MSLRLLKIRKIMEEKGFDFVLVTKAENHRYFSGFDNPDGSLLIGADFAAAFEDFRYIEAAKRTISKEDFQVILADRKLTCLLSDVVGAANLQRKVTVGYEDSQLPCRSLNALSKALEKKCEFVPLGDTFEEIRSEKDEDEIKCIVMAQRIAEKSFEELLNEIKYDYTESYLAAYLEFLMMKNGSEGKSFDTIAVSGKNSSSPHGVPRNVKLEKGFLTFDFGATVNGYHSDMTRTVCIGRATPEMKKVYETVSAAQVAALEAICEGASCFKTDAVARDIINKEYKGTFGHSLGHGVGLEIHEFPNLSPSSGDKRLKIGNVVTVEPGIYLEGKFGCRIEDMVAISSGGAVNLTNCPKELIEL